MNFFAAGGKVVRSIQYLSSTLDPGTTSDQITPGTAFVNVTKVIIIPLNTGIIYAGSGGQFFNVHPEILGNTNVTVYHSSPGGSVDYPAVWAGFAVEFY